MIRLEAFFRDEKNAHRGNFFFVDTHCTPKEEKKIGLSRMVCMCMCMGHYECMHGENFFPAPFCQALALLGPPIDNVAFFSQFFFYIFVTSEIAIRPDFDGWLMKTSAAKNADLRRRDFEGSSFFLIFFLQKKKKKKFLFSNKKKLKLKLIVVTQLELLPVYSCARFQVALFLTRV